MLNAQLFEEIGFFTLFLLRLSGFFFAIALFKGTKIRCSNIILPCTLGIILVIHSFGLLLEHIQKRMETGFDFIKKSALLDSLIGIILDFRLNVRGFNRYNGTVGRVVLCGRGLVGGLG